MLIHLRIGPQDCHQTTRAASALSGLLVIQQQDLAGCQAGMESTSQGECVNAGAPRPWERGNWVRMVGVRAPLPPPKQRPPPRQAVRDGETSHPPDQCSDSLERLIQLLESSIGFLYWPADCAISWGPCSCVCAPFICLDVFVSFNLCTHPAHKSHINMESVWLLMVSLLRLSYPAQLPLFKSLLVCTAAFRGSQPRCFLCGLSRLPEATQLIHSQLPHLPQLWSSVLLPAPPVCLSLCLCVSAAAGCLFSLPRSY